MPGFQIVEASMPKLGLRGTMTGRLAFHNMPVPKENILGPIGKGLKVALTVLDFGRTTFGACSVGTAKTCLQMAIDHANRRRQFGRALGEFEIVKKKVARIAAYTYAMEAMTQATASLLDRGIAFLTSKPTQLVLRSIGKETLKDPVSMIADHFRDHYTRLLDAMQEPVD